FGNLPAHPPALGIHIEPIIQRNLLVSRRMLQQVGDFYRHLVQARQMMAAEPGGITPVPGLPYPPRLS
ncbi:MAG: hypothetical protein HY647_01105, partial [Acidobacteria bacterium]|nr:hypothetical protein [Acidobacteriota bacterium]